MADTLKFSLVSPERELYSGEVDQVDLPGAEGDLGIMPNHSPFMAAMRTGIVTVTESGSETQFFIQGGFADVTPSGLIVLAERAVDIAALDKAEIEEQITAVEENLSGLSGDAAFTARQNLDGLRAVLVA